MATVCLGCGLQVSAEGVLSTRTCPGGGIGCAVTGDPACPGGGIYVKAGCGIQVTGDAVAAKVRPGGGILCDPATGLFIDPANVPPSGLVCIDNSGTCSVTSAPVTLAGSGASGNCLSASLKLSPDPCNGLECHSNGLYVFQDPAVAPGGVGMCYSGGPFGPLNGTFLDQVLFGPLCATITNPSACRDLDVWISDGGATTDVSRDSGDFLVSLKLQTGGGPFITTSKLGLDGPGPGGVNGALQIGGRGPNRLAPGASVTICLLFTASGTNVVNGVCSGFAGCVAQSGYWVE